MADKETDVSWALKLLTVDPDQQQSVLGGCAATVMATAAGFVTAIYVNYASRRPMWSGIQKHLSFPIIFGCIARYWEVRGQEKNAERDAVFRHYITLHPDDFPEPERKKYGELLNEWIPIR